MAPLILIQHGTVIWGDTAQIARLDILIEGAYIIEIAPQILLAEAKKRGEVQVIDATDRLVSPGLIQSHIHLCQTLFRGSADDLALLDWLKQRVWPMEAAHQPASLAASAQLAVAEMIKGGTTCALTMETVHDTEVVLDTVAATGFRATIGKCMMDKGVGVPKRLAEHTSDSLRESLSLVQHWQQPNARVRACFAPRFAISCTQELLMDVAACATEQGTIVHTHASENLQEIAIVEAETGHRNIAYLQQVGLVGQNIALAHCIHVDNTEMEILAATGTHVLHCPSSNLKLASGLARITEMLDHGISVSLGADGAPCNNNLDAFMEMRLAALLQKVRCGSTALPAKTAFLMATLGGAQTLGLAHEIGSIMVGKRADIIILNLQQLHCSPAPDPLATLVYAAHSSDVETVIIDGQIVMQQRNLLTLDEAAVLATAQYQYQELIKRAQI